MSKPTTIRADMCPQILFVASCILDAASWLLLEVEGVNNGWNMSYLVRLQPQR